MNIWKFWNSISPFFRFFMPLFYGNFGPKKKSIWRDIFFSDIFFIIFFLKLAPQKKYHTKKKNHFATRFFYPNFGIKRVYQQMSRKISDYSFECTFVFAEEWDFKKTVNKKTKQFVLDIYPFPTHTSELALQNILRWFLVSDANDNYFIVNFCFVPYLRF